MPKYTVQIIHKFYYNVEVEAEDMLEAQQLAIETDSADWEPVTPDHEEVEAGDVEEQIEDQDSTWEIPERGLECIASYSGIPNGIWCFKAYNRASEVVLKRKYLMSSFSEAKESFMAEINEFFEILDREVNRAK